MTTSIAKITFVTNSKYKVSLQFYPYPEQNFLVTISDLNNVVNIEIPVTLSLREFVVWIYSSKILWISAFRSLISDTSRFGMNYTESGKFVHQIFLNWFGLPKTIEGVKELGLPNTMEEFSTLDASKLSEKGIFAIHYMCSPDDHKPDEETCICYKCGMYKNPHEEEEAQALLCDCGFIEEECQCPGCDFCGEKDADCKCLLCDICDYCKCTDKNHEKKHKFETCTHEPFCTNKEMKKRHKRLSCICKSKTCEDCGLEECECESEEEYWC